MVSVRFNGMFPLRLAVVNTG